MIWSSLVDDPSEHPEQFPTEEEQNKERQRLFAILEKLVKWENSNDPERFWMPQRRKSCAPPATTRLRCWTPLPAAVPFPWKPSGWDWRPMPTT